MLVFQFTFLNGGGGGTCVSFVFCFYVLLGGFACMFYSLREVLGVHQNREEEGRDFSCAPGPVLISLNHQNVLFCLKTR